MATILDLFKSNPDLYHNRPTKVTSVLDMYDQTIHPKAPTKKMPSTFFEQELHGLRISSAVELNNPLLFGSDVPRIASRSTRTLEIMKEGRNQGITDGGLIGKGISKLTGGKLTSINQVRNKIGDFLGLPQPLIPTVVASKLGPGLSVQDILDQKNGTEFGKQLRQMGGGNPKTIVKQSLGSIIKFGKDLLRKTLFGAPEEIQNVFKSEEHLYYSDTQTYTQVQNNTRYKEPIDSIQDFNGRYHIDLATVSPVYGVDKGSEMWNTDLGVRIRKDKDTNPNLSKRLQPYDSSNTYTGTPDNRPPIYERSLEQRYKLTSQEDGLNAISPSGKNTPPKEELEKMDLIPFWVGFVGKAASKTHFRATLSGISETVSPSWSENTFFGNPFSFYTYTGIGREVTFSLFVYSSSPKELLYNWERVNKLTNYAYPNISPVDGKGKMINPPIIDFRLGDIYNGKIGYISSLSYTYPDNGTWETDPKIGLLPKFIEVSVSIHFIEQAQTAEEPLYDYKKSKDAVALLNDKSGATNFSTNGNLQSNGNFVKDKVLKRKTQGIDHLGDFKPMKLPITINGKETSIPKTFMNGFPNPLESQSAIDDIQKGVTGTDNLNELQTQTWENTLKPLNYGNYYNADFDLSPGEKIYKNVVTGEVIILFTDGTTQKLTER